MPWCAAGPALGVRAPGLLRPAQLPLHECQNPQVAMPPLPQKCAGRLKWKKMQTSHFCNKFTVSIIPTSLIVISNFIGNCIYIVDAVYMCIIMLMLGLWPSLFLSLNTQYSQYHEREKAQKQVLNA